MQKHNSSDSALIARYVTKDIAAAIDSFMKKTVFGSVLPVFELKDFNIIPDKRVCLGLMAEELKRVFIATLFLRGGYVSCLVRLFRQYGGAIDVRIYQTHGREFSVEISADFKEGPVTVGLLGRNLFHVSQNRQDCMAILPGESFNQLEELLKTLRPINAIRSAMQNEQEA
ncbi:MAG: hypothetical protein HGA67_00125 [Candidatus Yonathbacteria bacterium]|nr:hypothetical protein [Candidatus Yonathbacteria bacterium]